MSKIIRVYKIWEIINNNSRGDFFEIGRNDVIDIKYNKDDNFVDVIYKNKRRRIFQPDEILFEEAN